jgi:serine/threonine-protein kinase HipA
MTRLEVWLDTDLAGWLSHDPATNRFAFDYTPEWRSDVRGFPISPRLPLVPDARASADVHSAAVRLFFENLLPEGEALDHAAQASGTSKANLGALMIALGRETAGAIRILAEGSAPQGDGPVEGGLRPVTGQELSDRIRRRAQLPFSVWDGRVRLSIAGYQDKIAVYERAGQWFLVDDSRHASTVIMKPAPARRPLATLPANEYLCMQLAERVGVSVASTRLVHVPEPVLLVRRFDRVEEAGRIRRLHLIDGCQALGLPVGMKYERPYGDQAAVRDVRDGATLAKLFALLGHSPQPAIDRQALLRWAIFQVLIGNTDAHGKNVSFFCGLDGLRLAPAYDLVCIPALKDAGLSDTFAMAIGDAFRESELSPLEWAFFARQCGLPRRLVSQRLRELAVSVLDRLHEVADDVRREGVRDDVIEAVTKHVEPMCRRQAAMAPEIVKVDESLL